MHIRCTSSFNIIVTIIAIIMIADGGGRGAPRKRVLRLEQTNRFRYTLFYPSFVHTRPTIILLYYDHYSYLANTFHVCIFISQRKICTTIHTFLRVRVTINRISVGARFPTKKLVQTVKFNLATSIIITRVYSIVLYTFETPFVETNKSIV